MSDSIVSNPQDAEANEPSKQLSQEYIQKLILAHEKKKAFNREYMRQYRTEHREEANAYRRELYKRKKESKCVQ